MKTLITNEDGEPMGYEEHYPEDQHHDPPEEDWGPILGECHHCGKTVDLDCCDHINDHPVCGRCSADIHSVS